MFCAVFFFKWEHLLSCTRNRLPVCTVFVCRHVPGRYVHSAQSSPSNQPTAATGPPRRLGLHGLHLCVRKSNIAVAFFVRGEKTAWLKRCDQFRQQRKRGDEASLWSASSCARSAASTCCHLSSGHLYKRGVTSLVEMLPRPSGSVSMCVIMVSVPVGDNGNSCPLIYGSSLKDHSWSSGQKGWKCNMSKYCTLSTARIKLVDWFHRFPK